MLILIFSSLKDNWCDNALDLTNNHLFVDENWPDGIYCQWLVYTTNKDSFITLEFSNLTVRWVREIIKYSEVDSKNLTK